MFSLNDILQSAQGGQAIDNLARQFGLSTEQTQAAIDALTPAFSMGFQQKASQPGGLGDILAPIARGDHAAAYEDEQAAADPATVDQGNDILGQIFGSKGMSRDVASHAAQASGVSADILKQMLPVIAAMLMGGMFKNMNNQGLGGILGQLAGALTGQGKPQAQGAPSSGGLGDILGQMIGGRTQTQAGPGGFGDLIGGVLGQMMGRPTQPQAGQTPQAGPAPGGGLDEILGQLLGQPGAPQAGRGADPNLAQAGIDALGKMFQHGSQAGQQHQQNLQDLFASMFGGRR